ncbi:MAG: DNA repair exonuclease [Chloroflexi bacterium]|nr:DNA repair exonuclease [Chloroflexota bacterium]
MRKFRFVHTADLHLDSPFVGLHEVDERVASELREATFSTFDRIVDLCQEKDADFLLVAGDIYDSADRSLRAQLRFRDNLRRLSDSGIPTFVVYGNHDPLNRWSATLEWPEQTHTFGGDEVTSAPVVRNGEPIAYIYGISYPTRDVRTNLAKRFRRTDDGPFAIGLLHCNVGDDTGHEPYAPCTLDDLTRSGMDYWALGHVHNHRILSSKKPMVLYPGNPQGRSPRELGPRGCYVIDVDTGGHPSAEFVRVDTISWFSEAVSIDDLDTDEALISAVEATCQQMREQAEGRPAIGRITLTGRGPVHRSLARPGFVTELEERVRETEGSQNPFVWVERLEDATGSPIDLEQRRSGQDFVADFLGLVDEYRNEPERAASLRQHLGLLFDAGRAQKLLDEPTAADLRDWLDAAEAMCLDLLTAEED